MKQAAPILRRLSTRLWYVSGTSIFFLLFSLTYIPGWMSGYLDGRGAGYAANVAMISGILLASLCLTRLPVFHFLERHICRNYLTYASWCLAEMLFAAFFVALFFRIRFDGGYLSCLGKAFGMLCMTNVFPIALLTVAYAAWDRTGKTPAGSRNMVRFCDYAGNLKLAVDPRALLYIAAEENYIRIFYAEDGKVSDCQLRASMNSIGSIAAGSGLFRCQKSYYINPSRITALRKDKLGNASADLDCGITGIKVSRKLYNDLAALI